MTKNSLGDYIMLDPKEVPTVQQISDAVEVLKRCEAVFTRMRTKKDPPPKSMEMVASFLESLVDSYKNKLRNEPYVGPTEDDGKKKHSESIDKWQI